MKKEILAALTLIVLFSASLVNIHFLDRLTDDVATLVLEAESAAQSGDWETARRRAEAALDKWESSDGYTHIVLRHTEIEAAEDVLTELLSEVYSESPGGAKGAAVAAASRMRSIASIEHVKLGSIF